MKMQFDVGVWAFCVLELLLLSGALPLILASIASCWDKKQLCDFMKDYEEHFLFNTEYYALLLSR